MELSKFLIDIRKEIEKDDLIRETVLPKAREAVRRCSESIKETHRGHYEAAEKLLGLAEEIIAQAREKIETSEYLKQTRILDTAYQELTEASNVLSILRDGKFTSPDIFNIPSRPYLTGLADTIGELRRAVLDLIRSEELERAEAILLKMEETLDELHGFDFPNALVPDLRRKCDIARNLIERTRGDLTMAIHQTKLTKELQEFKRRLTE